MLEPNNWVTDYPASSIHTPPRRGMRRGFAADADTSFEPSLRLTGSRCAHRILFWAEQQDERGGEDVGAMLPGQAVGVGRSVRAGARMVLHLPGLQAPPR